MKTIKNVKMKSQKSWTRHLWSSAGQKILMCLLAGWMVACGNSSNNNNPQPVYQAPPVNPYSNCVNCQSVSGTVFFTATAQDQYGVMQFNNWTFSGQNILANNNPYASPIISYTGPVFSQGQLVVGQTVSAGYCQMPAGTYNLGTVALGQWSAGIVFNLRLQAYGPAQIIMSVSQAQVAAKTGSQLGSTWSEVPAVGRLFGNLIVESVNGISCQTSVLIQ